MFQICKGYLRFVAYKVQQTNLKVTRLLFFIQKMVSSVSMYVFVCVVLVSHQGSQKYNARNDDPSQYQLQSHSRNLHGVTACPSKWNLFVHVRRPLFECMSNSPQQVLVHPSGSLFEIHVAQPKSPTCHHVHSFGLPHTEQAWWSNTSIKITSKDWNNAIPHASIK